MNTISIIGNITKDPELKATASNKYIAFTIAVQRNYKNKAGNYDTDFIPCLITGKPAETFAKYVKKGNKLAITGALNSKTVEGKTYYTVMVSAFDFLTVKHDTAEPTIAPDSEIPFEV